MGRGRGIKSLSLSEAQKTRVGGMQVLEDEGAMPTYTYAAIDNNGRRAVGIRQARDEMDLEETLEARGFHLVKALMHSPHAKNGDLTPTPSFGKGKLIITLVINWLTGFPGSGNLAFLYDDKSHRTRAIISLSIITFVLVIAFSSTYALNPGVLNTKPLAPAMSTGAVPLSVFSLVFILAYLSMAIWMTLSAIGAYREYRRQREEETNGQKVRINNAHLQLRSH
jgi:uncharacterized membrane protein (DUF485 family)